MGKPALNSSRTLENLLEIKLCAVENSLAKAWETFCADLDFVTIERQSILDVECDAVVSPANSFGFMDGGIDAVYLDYFGSKIQLSVRRQICDYYAGELLVGAADIVETDDDSIPFLIIAPTMRVPMVLHKSPNAYLAARAIFLLVKQGIFKSGRFAGQPISKHVKTVAISGLGTGVGKIGYKTCAKQVREAIEHTLLGHYKMPQTWAEASERHQLLYNDQIERLQY